MSKPRIWISNAKPKAGDIVRVRALVEHRMESGLRLSKEGQVVPRNIIHEFKATFNGEPLFNWQPETAISQNPYIEFTFVARRSGALEMSWTDDQGAVITGQTELSISD
ncbi:thiosulfate oxidation carrier complex protein SoxZ [Alcaligenes nematophilus]|jgi:sulfur-oxidizing protein SoxZ|uniref:Thiosulfate oxidation carrier complex protein SoxZ n=1 Tax=Alcaligenes phenolicus TaxID=232846 RepID=A0ABV2BDF8_9BURK|nr:MULTISPECIES: thiosulfate oxidation carrier complex protein SoxZ [Alcaligenes]EKU29177.1 sulfur oxidation protein SoxZ [Alcaligenes sp. HPC1271]ERI34968.1 sulfur oxidation protein SoxZ [Alcaligenes sp. EGD-AK7]KGP02548.1 sulfur oxidation protein SoxZ [Alcaligenes faecalis]KVX05184.1 thiosulfate oxidation carrier complex protein SoxZ [Alcaligenes faecalis]MCX5473802.1 thiosulfate oxidation carrier complex protein SoxZ [Alcaligenes nematophilus]